MYTRNQYMNHEISHREYYAQFVNEQVKNLVIRFIGKERLLKSKDEHLNDIPLKDWDLLGGFVFRGSEMVMKPTTIEPIDYKLIKEAGDGVSSATLVCIYKEAARQLIEKFKNIKLTI